MNSDRDEYREDEVFAESGDGIELVVEHDEDGARGLNVYDANGKLLLYIGDHRDEWQPFVDALTGEEEVAEATPVAARIDTSETVYVVHNNAGTVYVSTTDPLLAYKTAYREAPSTSYAVEVEGFRNGIRVDLP